MNVHISNFFGTRNKGDEAMLMGLINLLESNGFNKISISSFGKLTEDRIKLSDYKVLPSLAKTSGLSSKMYTFVLYYLTRYFPLRFISIFISIFGNNEDLKTVNSIRSSSFLITTGGPFMVETYKKIIIKVTSFNYIVPFLEIILARRFGIDCYVLGQSFNQINSMYSKAEYKFVLNNCNLFAARNSFSANQINKSFNFLRVNHHPDLAFAINYDLKDQRKDLVFINARSLTSEMLFELTGYSRIKNEEIYIDFFKNLLKRFIKQNPSIKFLFFCQSEDDYFVSKEISAELETKFYEIIDPKMTLVESLKLISKCSFAITTRYHSMIFALVLGIPFVALQYDRKIKNLLFDVKLSSRGCNLNKNSINFILNEYKKDYNKASFKLRLIAKNEKLKLDDYFRENVSLKAL